MDGKWADSVSRIDGRDNVRNKSVASPTVNYRHCWMVLLALGFLLLFLYEMICWHKHVPYTRYELITHSHRIAHTQRSLFEMGFSPNVTTYNKYITVIIQ